MASALHIQQQQAQQVELSGSATNVQGETRGLDFIKMKAFIILLKWALQTEEHYFEIQVKQQCNNSIKWNLVQLYMSKDSIILYSITINLL